MVFSDTGASVGEISGHTKPISSVDLKQTRPYRMITGSEDLSVNFFEGPPFKFKKSHKEHQRFVNSVRFSPNGEKFVSVSSDKTCLVYDGKTGDKIGELDPQEAHKLGVYSAAWSPDSSKILTVSADKTAKLWDSTTYKLISTFDLSSEDQQLGCIWNKDGEIVTLSLSGYLNFLDLDNPSKPKKIVRGHNKLITALAYDPVGQKIFSGDFGARLLEWDPNSAETYVFEGSPHESQISALSVSKDNLFTISMDDTLNISSISNRKYGSRIPLDLQPSGLATTPNDPNLAVVCGGKTVLIIRNGAVASRTELKFDAISVAINPSANEVSIGGKDFKVHVFSLQNNSLNPKHELTEHRGEIISLNYSHDGKYLAVGDGNREVIVWEATTRKVSGWVFHTTRINSVSWSPDNIHVASVGTDSNLIVWNVNEPSNRIIVKNAHYGGANEVTWMNSTTVLTGGQDCALKSWSITI